MKFDVAGISEAGPRSINEDQIAYWLSRDGTLFAAIADGLGGMGGGESASQLAIAALQNNLKSGFDNKSSLLDAVKRAHDDIILAQKVSPSFRRMATTLTVGIFFDHKLFAAHAGDSRLSVVRGNGVKKLTTDHSEGQRLFDAGKLTREEFHDYHRKNILDNALGVHDELRIDQVDFPVKSGDKFFFTTDGVHGKLFLREMMDIASHHNFAEEFVMEVGEIVKNRSPSDNFSIIAVFAS